MPIATTMRRNSALRIFVGAAAILAALSSGPARAQVVDLAQNPNRVESFSSIDGDVKVEIDGPKPQSPESSVSLDDADIRATSSSDYDLFRNAIQKARTLHASRLIIPNRLYDIHPPKGADHQAAILDFSNLADLTVEGDNAQIRFHDIDYRAGIGMSGDERILLRNLSVDWAPILAYPGIISREVNPFTDQFVTVFAVDRHYPIDPENPPRLTTLFEFDIRNAKYFTSHLPNVDLMFGCAENFLRCPRYSGNQRFILAADRRLDGIPEGRTVVATLRNNNVAAILIGDGSSNVALENISVFSSPGSGIVVINAGKGFRITRCAITRRSDGQGVSGENSRLISTAADAINFIATAGDILVEDSDIGFEADDGINIRGMLSRVENVARDDRTFYLKEPNTDAYRDNDQIRLFRSTDFAPMGGGKIQSVHVSNGRFTIVLDKPVVGLSSLSDIFVASERLGSGRYIIRNNRFHDNKNRGILVRGDSGLIEHNTILDTTSAGIQLATEAGLSYSEGPPVTNVIVRDNSISGTNKADYSQSPGAQQFPAAIMIYATTGRDYSPFPIDQRIRIENNTVKNVPGVGVFVTSAKDIVISGNKFAGTNLYRYGGKPFQHAMIYIEKSEDIHVHDNQRSEPDMQSIVADKATTKNLDIQQNEMGR